MNTIIHLSRILLPLLCLWLAGPAHAHKLKIFAFAEGARIEGQAYFVGGARASGAQIVIRDDQGRELANLTPDEEGRFVYIAQKHHDHIVEADSRDGHVARWTVHADELTSDLPESDDGQPAPPAPASEAFPTNSPTPPAPSTKEQQDDKQLAALVNRAVAHQVRPLREALVSYEDKIRLHDILGGLGYITGLAGLGLWWQCRRDRRR